MTIHQLLLSLSAIVGVLAVLHIAGLYANTSYVDAIVVALFVLAFWVLGLITEKINNSESRRDG